MAQGPFGCQGSRWHLERRSPCSNFVNGRQADVGAFDTPKHAGIAVGHVHRLGADHFDLETDDAQTLLHNGDALTWLDLQGELQSVPVNVAQPLANTGGRGWRLFPNAPMGALKGPRRGTAIRRNRDMAWERLLEKKSAERRIGVALTLTATAGGRALEAIDDDGHRGRATTPLPHEAARDAARAGESLRAHLARLADTIFEARGVTLDGVGARFVPPSVLNALRREAVAALEAARAAAWQPLPRARPVEPPAPCPEDTLSYLANVFNTRAAAFYARHGVRVIDAAYESHEDPGDVSLMITKHCVRYSLSLCPKQAKGVTGVQGTVKAEPLTLVHGPDRFTLRFDCRPCEMHVVGRIRRHVLRQAAAEPLTFYRTRPARPEERAAWGAASGVR